MNHYLKYLDKLESLEGKTFVVTGANSGLGFNTTYDLVYKKAKVIMACRNLRKAEEARNCIISQIKEADIEIIHYDQSDFNSIDEFCSKILEKNIKIDGLICNAGIYFPKANYRTKNNFELTFGTNYLGVFYLLKHLNPLLEKFESKVIIVTSLTGFWAKKRIRLEDNEKLSRNKVYGYSKYCLSRLGYELNSKKSKVNYFLTHPGICKTNIISSDQTGLPNWFSKIGHVFLYFFVHSSAKACLTNLLALDTNDNERKYIKPRGIFSISGYPIKRKIPQYAKKNIIEETYQYLEDKGFELR